MVKTHRQVVQDVHLADSSYSAQERPKFWRLSPTLSQIHFSIQPCPLPEARSLKFLHLYLFCFCCTLKRKNNLKKKEGFIRMQTSNNSWFPVCSTIQSPTVLDVHSDTFWFVTEGAITFWSVSAKGVTVDVEDEAKLEEPPTFKITAPPSKVFVGTKRAIFSEVGWFASEVTSYLEPPNICEVSFASLTRALLLALPEVSWLKFWVADELIVDRSVSEISVFNFTIVLKNGRLILFYRTYHKQICWT